MNYSAGRRLRSMLRAVQLTGMAVLMTVCLPQLAPAEAEHERREQLIPILGVTMGKQPTGTVEREDHNGLVLYFKSKPGKFSRMAQTAVEQAIYRSARSLGVSPDTWTVQLTVPYSGVIIYGESLSAMIGLSVVALSRGQFIAPDRAMTGTITADGHIGAVGSVPMKIEAARAAHLGVVLIPDERDPGDNDYVLPFLMQVSPVDSVQQAYAVLTAHAGTQ